MFVKKNMKNLFKKQRIVQDVQVQDVEVQDDVLVEEIHETFFTEVDRLLEDAKVFYSLEDLIDKCERLKY